MTDWEIAGLWFGILLPACYFAAQRGLDRMAILPAAEQMRQNRLALICVALALPHAYIIPTSPKAE